MARRLTFSLGVAAAASLLLRAATGCGTSSNLGGNPDAATDATGNESDAALDGPRLGMPVGPRICQAGCLCFAVDACPAGCYPSVTEEADGSGSELFCSNGIVQCVAGGLSWSFGSPANNCPGINPPGPPINAPSYSATYLDGGPDGAFCCEPENVAVDAASDGGASGGPCTANSDCDAGDQCLFPIGDCSAKGQCLSLASLGAECDHEVAYCGCNGTTVEGLCGPPYAYGPTPSADAASPCGHADAGDAGGE
jgi:hypothetical protein